MFKKILLVLALIVIALLVIIMSKPDTYSVSRSAVLNAPAQTVFDQVNDFHKWEAWSPWAKLDPKAKNTFEGPTSGVGASFAWAGDHNVGEGKQTIVESKSPELIRIKLEFYKPFPGVSTSEFKFAPENNGTRVTWTMSGENNFMSKAMSLVMNCDTMIGGYFEQGLNNLKGVVETVPAAQP